MGIYDREYLRVGPRSRSGVGHLRLISFNTWLILANIAIFVLQVGLPKRLFALPGALGPIPIDPLTAYGHLSMYTSIRMLEVWRLITFQFLHGNLLHLAFNLFGLWVFGTLVEQYLGFKRYAAFYLVCGICGGLLFLILALLGQLGVNLPGVPQLSPAASLVGASAGVFGVIMACAFIEPKAIVDPIPLVPIGIPMKWFAYIYVAIAAVNLIMGGQNAGGDAAHLGGAIAGYFFIRNTHLLRDFFDVFNRSDETTPGEREKRRGTARGGPDAAQVDQVLAKIKGSGLRSLTDDERTILRRATLRRK
jgi:membrane associated rhomboid family serine protease